MPPIASIRNFAAWSPHWAESVLTLAVTSSVSTRLSKLMIAMPLAQASASNAGRRGRRAGNQDDGVDVGIDHRLDLLDLDVGVALGIGDHQLVDEPLLLQLLDFGLDRALGLLHPGRHGIDVGPADRVRRLAIALDAVGGGVGREAGAEAQRRPRQRAPADARKDRLVMLMFPLSVRFGLRFWSRSVGHHGEPPCHLDFAPSLIVRYFRLPCLYIGQI